MTEQTTPTAAQLLAQRNELDKQIAVANLNGLKAVQAALKAGKVATLAADLEALLPQLAPENTMGTPHHQANCVITTVRGVTQFFDREVERVEALVAAQSA
ncbi:hypothetical protein [Novosphingobium sp. HII-3]|uniref:hypothetical protein n=1 Tax=Novosphingobium sp. HII-3 TaxID=2075565 RepID=UPI0018EC1E74|nr:hypothetical protein [Novosphingobium sp. HII-3]